MKLGDYLKIIYPMEIIPDNLEGGYVVKYPDLIGCISQGETLTEAIKNAEEAKSLWIESELEQGHVIPLPKDDLYKYSGEYKIRMPKELHSYLVYMAKKQGVSLNQYCLYLLSKNNALDNA